MSGLQTRLKKLETGSTAWKPVFCIQSLDSSGNLVSCRTMEGTEYRPDSNEDLDAFYARVGKAERGTPILCSARELAL